MKRISLVSSFAVIFALLGSANAEEMDYQELISGTAAPSSFDINGDGVLKGHYVTFAGRSNLGPVHGALMVEYDFPNIGPDPAQCPAAGTLRLPILVSVSTRALTGTEDQVFLRDDTDSAVFCLNPATGAFTMSLNGAFIGGMGRFVGATGTYEYTGSGAVLVQDAVGHPFGGFVVETEGAIVLPDPPEVEVPENQAPVAIVTPENQTALTRQIQLDGSTSSDPDGGPITFHWRVTGRPAALIKGDTATPIVQFGSGRGDYTFELTVTDSSGATDTATTTVMYAGL